MAKSTLRLRGVEANLFNQIADMGLFNRKSKSARSPYAKHTMDANLLDSRRMWNEIKSYATRQMSAEQLTKDIRSIKC